MAMKGSRSEVGKCVSETCPLFPYRIGGVSASLEKSLGHSEKTDSEHEFVHIETVSEANSENMSSGIG